MSQPPKISPFGLVSFGIAIVRMTSSPLGWAESICARIHQHHVVATALRAVPRIHPSQHESERPTGPWLHARLQDQHAIAVTVNAISLADRFRVGSQNK